jgi:hypothetical protein
VSGICQNVTYVIGCTVYSGSLLGSHMRRVVHECVQNLLLFCNEGVLYVRDVVLSYICAPA